MIVTVGGVAKTVLINSIKLQHDLNSQKSASFIIQGTTPNIGAVVTIGDSFKGVVAEARQIKMGNVDYCEIYACDYSYLATKRRYTLDIPLGLTEDDQILQMPLSEVIKKLVDDVLSQEGVTIGSLPTGIDDIGIGPCYWENIRVSDILTAICAEAGLIWKIDEDKVLHVYKQSEGALKTITNILEDGFSVTDEGIDLANKVILKDVPDLEVQYDYNAQPPADGVTKMFTTIGKPYIYASPAILVDGDTQTIGIWGEDTDKDWYWIRNSSHILQNEEATPIATGTQMIVATWHNAPKTVIKENAAAQASLAGMMGGTGIVERVFEPFPISSVSGAINIADQYLDAYSGASTRVEFKTYTSVNVGDRVSISTDEVSGIFYVDSLEFEEDDAGNIIYRIVANSQQSVYPGNYVSRALSPFLDHWTDQKQPPMPYKPLTLLIAKHPLHYGPIVVPDETWYKMGSLTTQKQTFWLPEIEDYGWYVYLEPSETSINGWAMVDRSIFTITPEDIAFEWGIQSEADYQYLSNSTDTIEQGLSRGKDSLKNIIKSSDQSFLLQHGIGVFEYVSKGPTMQYQADRSTQGSFWSAYFGAYVLENENPVQLNRRNMKRLVLFDEDNAYRFVYGIMLPWIFPAGYPYYQSWDDWYNMVWVQQSWWPYARYRGCFEISTITVDLASNTTSIEGESNWLEEPIHDWLEDLVYNFPNPDPPKIQFLNNDVLPEGEITILDKRGNIVATETITPTTYLRGGVNWIWVDDTGEAASATVQVDMQYKSHNQSGTTVLRDRDEVLNEVQMYDTQLMPMATPYRPFFCIDIPDYFEPLIEDDCVYHILAPNHMPFQSLTLEPDEEDAVVSFPDGEGQIIPHIEYLSPNTYDDEPEEAETAEYYARQSHIPVSKELSSANIEVEKIDIHLAPVDLFEMNDLEFEISFDENDYIYAMCDFGYTEDPEHENNPDSVIKKLIGQQVFNGDPLYSENIIEDWYDQPIDLYAFYWHGFLNLDHELRQQPSPTTEVWMVQDGNVEKIWDHDTGYDWSNITVTETCTPFHDLDCDPGGVAATSWVNASTPDPTPPTVWPWGAGGWPGASYAQFCALWEISTITVYPVDSIAYESGGYVTYFSSTPSRTLASDSADITYRENEFWDGITRANLHDAHPLPLTKELAVYESEMDYVEDPLYMDPGIYWVWPKICVKYKYVGNVNRLLARRAGYLEGFAKTSDIEETLKFNTRDGPFIQMGINNLNPLHRWYQSGVLTLDRISLPVQPIFNMTDDTNVDFPESSLSSINSIREERPAWKPSSVDGWIAPAPDPFTKTKANWIKQNPQIMRFFIAANKFSKLNVNIQNVGEPHKSNQRSYSIELPDPFDASPDIIRAGELGGQEPEHNNPYPNSGDGDWQLRVYRRFDTINSVSAEPVFIEISSSLDDPAFETFILRFTSSSYQRCYLPDYRIYVRVLHVGRTCSSQRYYLNTPTTGWVNRYAPRAKMTLGSGINYVYGYAAEILDYHKTDKLHIFDVTIRQPILKANKLMLDSGFDAKILNLEKYKEGL